MKVKSLILAGTTTVTLFAFATLGFADGVATDVGKAGKDTGKVTAKVAEKTAKGTEKVAKGTARGTAKAAEETGHGVKKAAVKTADALK